MEQTFEHGVIVGGLARELAEKDGVGVRWHVLREDLREGYVKKAEQWLLDFYARNPHPNDET